MWILEHLPARDEWEKHFATESEALEEMSKHVCDSCRRMGALMPVSACGREFKLYDDHNEGRFELGCS